MKEERKDRKGGRKEWKRGRRRKKRRREGKFQTLIHGMKKCQDFPGGPVAETSPSTVILECKKTKFVTVSIVSPSV